MKKKAMDLVRGDTFIYKAMVAHPRAVVVSLSPIGERMCTVLVVIFHAAQTPELNTVRYENDAEVEVTHAAYTPLTPVQAAADKLLTALLDLERPLASGDWGDQSETLTNLRELLDPLRPLPTIPPLPALVAITPELLATEDGRKQVRENIEQWARWSEDTLVAVNSISERVPK